MVRQTANAIRSAHRFNALVISQKPENLRPSAAMELFDHFRCIFGEPAFSGWGASQFLRFLAGCSIRNPKSESPEIRKKSEARNPKPEIRSPKESRDPKTEFQLSGAAAGLPCGTAVGCETGGLRSEFQAVRISEFGFRTSLGFRASGFGFPSGQLWFH